jgi:hypothetical protein
MCKSFRYSREQYGCALHGECLHTAGWSKCDDFAPVVRAGSGTPAVAAQMSIQSESGCGGCKGKVKIAPLPGEVPDNTHWRGY